MDTVTVLRSNWDRLLSAVLIVGGAIALLASSLKVRDELYVANQLSVLMSGVLGGLAAGALGCALVVSACLHDEWRRLDQLERAVQQRRALRVLPSAVMGASDEVIGDDAIGPSVGLWLRAQWDRVLGWATVAASTVLFVVGSRAVANALYPPKQVAYIVSCGLTAFLLMVIGTCFLLLADLRDSHHKARRIEQKLGMGASDLRPLPVSVAVMAITGIVAGIGLLPAGWARASNALTLSAGINGLTVAVAGLGLALFASAAGLMTLRRRFLRRAGALLAHLVSQTGDGERESAEVGADTPSGVWTADGLRRYHRPNCPALARAGAARRRLETPMEGVEPCLLCDAAEESSVLEIVHA